MTEIEQIEEIIIADLKANLTGIVTCETWQGEIEDLLKTPQKLPGIWVIYRGAKFGERLAIGSDQIKAEQRWAVAVIVKSLKSGRADGSRGAYDLLEATRERLQGKRLTPLPGFLWPASEDLIAIGKGAYAYGQEYKRVVND